MMDTTRKWLAICATVLVGMALGGCGDLVSQRRTGQDAANGDVNDGSYYPNSGPSGSGAGWSDEDGNVQNGQPGDRYEGVGTNPFVLTAHDPFSTFAADVDTASYDIFRRDVNDDRLPQPGSVRVEEYVNSFDYRYDAPTQESEHPFAISLAAGPGILHDSTTVLRVGIQATRPPPSEKKPANLVFLIDISGSMSSNDKLPLVKRVLTKTLDILEPGDTVAIVTYAGSTGVALAPTDVVDRQTIENAINSFSAGGSTAGAAGITLAYEQAEAGFIPGGINHIVLCTDGDFNVGLSSDTALVELIEEKRESGITLTVLGFGYGNLNDSMMEKISNAGNGIYGVISSAEHADAYVEGRMLSNLILIAKDLKLQVEFNPDQVTAYRLIGYENRAIADDEFRDDAVDAGEVGAGHNVTALYELVLSGGVVPEANGAPDAVEGDPVEGERQIDPDDMVLVKVRYKSLDADADAPAREVSASLRQADIALDAGSLDVGFRWATAVAALAEILKGSPYASVDRLAAVAGVVHEQTWLDSAWVEFVTLFDKAQALLVAP